MLQKLQIKNYALIDSLDIEFGKGLNIITGETGAGKSIIMGALSLILGQRAENKFFFDPSKKCIIEGVFDIQNYQLNEFFNEFDLDFENITYLRREISTDGKSRAFVNDTPVTLNILKSLGEKLIDIHSQHATLQLANSEFQLNILDSVGNLHQKRREFSHLYQKYKSVSADLKQLQEKSEKNIAELDFKQYLLNELEDANLIADEQVKLEEDLNKLENAEEIKSYVNGALSLLDHSESSIIEALKQVQNNVSKASRFAPSLQEFSDRIQSVVVETKDIADELSRADSEIEIDAEKIVFIQERLNLLYSLQQKHRVDSVEALLQLKDELDDFIQQSSNQDEHIEKLEKEVLLIKDDLLKQAQHLHNERKQQIPKVIDFIKEKLFHVGMPDSQLQINLIPLSFDSYKSYGGDQIQFLFSSNKGQSPQPVGKVASGGELSRLMLAVKSLIAQSISLPTIIFDEIDTGISGEVALRVGDVMEGLGEHLQVIAISHLPQIASKGSHHFKVLKSNKGEKTQTFVELLTDDKRILEIAEMLSGSNPSDAAIEHAKTLLSGV